VHSEQKQYDDDSELMEKASR